MDPITNLKSDRHAQIIKQGALAHSSLDGSIADDPAYFTPLALCVAA